jgi:hypothetical protein
VSIIPIDAALADPNLLGAELLQPLRTASAGHDCEGGVPTRRRIVNNHQPLFDPTADSIPMDAEQPRDVPHRIGPTEPHQPGALHIKSADPPEKQNAAALGGWTQFGRCVRVADDPILRRPWASPRQRTSQITNLAQSIV